MFLEHAQSPITGNAVRIEHSFARDTDIVAHGKLPSGCTVPSVIPTDSWI